MWSDENEITGSYHVNCGADVKKMWLCLPISEYILRYRHTNLYCLFPYIDDSLQLFSLLTQTLNMPQIDYIQGTRLNVIPKLSNWIRFRPSFQSHAMWLTLYFSNVSKVKGRNNMTFKQFSGFLFQQD